MIDFPYTITEKAIVAMFDAKTYTVNVGDERYADVENAIRQGDKEQVMNLMDVKGKIISDSNGGIYILNGMLRCDKFEIPSLLASRIIASYRKKLSLAPLTNFLSNLMENPNESGTIVEEVYAFVEACSLPITPDGCLLAYKMVRSDFKDLYTGTMDNSVGVTVSMDRAHCDFNRGNLCSSGLHFCSEAYLGKYGTRGSDQVVIVKVNPRDITSIPPDYNNAKGRACRYEIVDAIGWDDLIEPLVSDEYTDPDAVIHFDWGNSDESVESSWTADADNFPTPYRWEVRQSGDGELVDAFETRNDARAYRSGDPELFIYDTKNNEVVAGVMECSDLPEDVDEENAVYEWSEVSITFDDDDDDTDVKPNPSAKLNDGIVYQIRKILKNGAYDTIASLALMYGVSERTIRRIRDNESWTHVVV